ncbi:cation:proton antiporter [Crocosphaera sp. Alani8]|uniref:cation:proton antiporter n=1 Tax=Crocosphaera sp. Alani8 TaxID=3038952 RepID=UPI00313DA413
MEASLKLTLLISEIVAAGITAQVLASYLKLPSIIVLLLLGIVLGQDGLGLIEPNLLGDSIEVIVSLSVALILFEGGLSLSITQLKEVSGSLRNLVTIGIIITSWGGAIAAHWFGQFPWPLAWLYSSLVVVTGPTVINPLLKNLEIEQRTATLLEGEGVLIDPLGAILAIVILHVVLNRDIELLMIAEGVLLRLFLGSAIGVLGGLFISWVLQQLTKLSKELKTLIILAVIWLLFSLAQILDNESGLVTVVVAGIVLGTSPMPDEVLVRQFNTQLSILSNSILFVLLAANLSIASLFALGWGSVLTVSCLMFLIRPLNVFICTWNQGFDWRSQLFISWVAPKGIIAVSMVSLFAISLTKQDINGGEALKALVFLTVFLTVFLQGLTASWVAKFLHLNPSEPIRENQKLSETQLRKD